MADEQQNNLAGFIGGTLDQRLIRSKRRDRERGGSEALFDSIHEQLVQGEEWSRHGVAQEPTAPRHVPASQRTAAEQVAFERAAVAAIIEQGGGATRTWHAAQKTRRRNEIEQLRQERLRNDAEVSAAAEDEEVPDWLLNFATDELAPLLEGDDNDLTDDDDNWTVPEVAWR